MYRYGLYIIQQLTVSTLLVTFSLTSIVWLAQALRFVDYIVNRGISILTFLHLTVLLIPSLLMVVLPFALIVSVLYVYHKLMQESELVVLQGAGLSRWQLARPAIQFALLVMIISYSITLYFLPVTYNRFRELQYFLRDNYASLLLQEEVFNSPVEGLTVFLRARDKNDVLHGILVHDSRVPGQPVTMMAQEGTLVKTAQGPRFMLRSGNRQEMREGKLSVLDFDSYALDIGFYSTKQRTRTPNPQELSLPD